jgi:hypothetical protein
MKIYFFIIVFLSSFSAFAQNPYYDSTKQLQIVNTQGSINKNLIILGQLKPAVDTFKMAVQDSGSIASKNNNLYLWNGYSWKALGANITAFNPQQYSNNTAAIAAGLPQGTVYKLPYDNANDRYLLAIVGASLGIAFISLQNGQSLQTELGQNLIIE